MAKKEFLSMKMSQTERNIQLETIYKRMLKDLDANFSELLSAYILLVLKLEGVIGEHVGKAEIDMVESIKKGVFADKNMHKEMLDHIQHLRKLAE